MKTKKQNGFVIELMITFMLVTFGFCLLITNFVGAITATRRNAKSKIDSQTVFNQIGEYYMRSVEAGGIFPKNYDDIRNNTNIKKKQSKKYAWLDDNGNGKLSDDDETVKFFSDNNYNYTDKIYKTYGSIWEFYNTKSVLRRLTVTENEKIKMILTVNEVYTGKNSSSCEVITWYTGDNLSAPPDDGNYTETKLTTLQKLWKFFGETVDDIKEVDRNDHLLTRIYKIANIVSNNWLDIFNPQE